jgi:Ribbon-helix-helix protein, copG family
MPRSPVAMDRRTVRTSVLLPEDVHARLQALAEANDVSAAWVVRLAVQRFLDEHNGQQELPLRAAPYRQDTK